MTRPTNNFGIGIAGESKEMQSGQETWKNDTRKRKWTVDVDRQPPHLQVIERPGGTKFTLATGTATYKEEIIFSMKHGMPFPPKFLCFFYCVDGPNASAIGAYTQDLGYMEYDNILYNEGVFAFVDEEYFYIKHFMETFGLFDSGDITGHGDDFLFRIRFELLNQEAFYLGDKGY